MTKKWLVRIVITGTFALVWLLFPVIGQGADKKVVDEPIVAHPQSGATSDSDVDKRLDQIDNDIESILGEQDKIKDQLKRNRMEWSGSLRVTNNNFHFIDKSYNSVPAVLIDDKFNLIRPSLSNPDPYYARTTRNNIDKSYGSEWVSRLRLTMSYEITDNLRFYGQIVAFKYFNLYKENAYLLDMSTTDYPLNSGLLVERAFFDWAVTNWLTITAGRSSSPEGPPAELKENAERNTTWGVQMIEAATDGIGFTIDLSSILLEGTYFRMNYLPWANFADANITNDNNLFQNDGFKEMQSFSALYEMKIPGLGNNVFQIGTVVVPLFRPRNNPIFLNTDSLDNPIYPEKPKGDTNLGSYAHIDALLELKNVVNTGIDIFGAYAFTILNPTNQRMIYMVPSPSAVPVYMQTENGKIIYVQSTIPTDPKTALPIGLASYDDPKKGTHYGHFAYAGFRYSPPESLWSFFKNYPLRIGFEYNYGSKYHIAWSSPTDILVNKYAIKGDVFEAYIIQQLVPKHLFMRVGYLYLERKYSGSYLGPTLKVNQMIHNIYALLDASW